MHSRAFEPSHHVSPGRQGERTYHVLYQLCRGCSREQSAKLKLLPAADFQYIGDSAGLTVPGVNDIEWWAASHVFAINAEDQHESAHHDATSTSPQVGGLVQGDGRVRDR